MSSNSERISPPSTPHAGRQIPSWQRTAIRQMTWVGFAAALAGITVSMLFERLAHTKGGGAVFIPWLIVFLSWCLPLTAAEFGMPEHIQTTAD